MHIIQMYTHTHTHTHTHIQDKYVRLCMHIHTTQNVYLTPNKSSGSPWRSIQLQTYKHTHIHIHTHTHTNTHTHTHIHIHIHTSHIYLFIHPFSLSVFLSHFLSCPWSGFGQQDRLNYRSLLQKSPTKETYILQIDHKRDSILQQRPVILSILLTLAP